MVVYLPTKIDEALEILAGHPGTILLAGGTDVLVQLRSEMVEPDLIVDIKHLDGLRDISEEDGGFRIGAGVGCCQ